MHVCMCVCVRSRVNTCADTITHQHSSVFCDFWACFFGFLSRWIYTLWTDLVFFVVVVGGYFFKFHNLFFFFINALQVSVSLWVLILLPSYSQSLAIRIKSCRKTLNISKQEAVNHNLSENSTKFSQSNLENIWSLGRSSVSVAFCSNCSSQ